MSLVCLYNEISFQIFVLLRIIRTLKPKCYIKSTTQARRLLAVWKITPLLDQAGQEEVLFAPAKPLCGETNLLAPPRSNLFALFLSLSASYNNTPEGRPNEALFNTTTVGRLTPSSPPPPPVQSPIKISGQIFILPRVDSREFCPAPDVGPWPLMSQHFTYLASRWFTEPSSYFFSEEHKKKFVPSPGRPEHQS